MGELMSDCVNVGGGLLTALVARHWLAVSTSNERETPSPTPCRVGQQCSAADISVCLHCRSTRHSMTCLDFGLLVQA